MVTARISGFARGGLRSRSRLSIGVDSPIGSAQRGRDPSRERSHLRAGPSTGRGVAIRLVTRLRVAGVQHPVTFGPMGRLVDSSCSSRTSSGDDPRTVRHVHGLAQSIRRKIPTVGHGCTSHSVAVLHRVLASLVSTPLRCSVLLNNHRETSSTRPTLIHGPYLDPFRKYYVQWLST
jgi:hypothetical protein